MPTPHRIIIADDHQLLRLGIRAVLATRTDLEIVSEAADGDTALNDIMTMRPDLVVLDITMPGKSGLDILQEVRLNAPDIRVMVLSSHDEPHVVLDALKRGARAYLLKDCMLEDLHAAIIAVLDGHVFLSPQIEALASAANDTGTETLTTRQQEILRWIALGKSTKEIARLLGISPKTVEFHRGQLIQRLGCRDVASLTLKAVRSGLVDPARDQISA
ncbi:response regulator [Amantichitinum ursilacus]|uniref:Oxygen regulatory protein NreC n=1 Tax=Amantichitinum ursilacus TaxID=857265 RepID=A0A0N0GKN7_9NEIS|nr:response regulator transcription factor [Amantichitinum ursilacus]KPC49213.1 Oxygen regulatory protein NreC [Amantichitinum ursilacus]